VIIKQAAYELSLLKEGVFILLLNSTASG